LSRWLKILSEKYSLFFCTVKRDFVYVLLMLFLTIFVSTSLYYSKKIDNDTQNAQKVEETVSVADKDQLSIKMSDVTPGFMIFAFILFLGAVAGLILFIYFSVKGFPFVRKESENSVDSHVGYPDTEETQIVVCPWSVWDVSKILIVFFTAYFVANFLHEFIVAVFDIPKDRINYNFVMILDMLTSEIVAVFFIFRRLSRYGISIGDFGFRIKNSIKYIFWGMTCYLMFLPLFFLTNILVLKLSQFLNIELKAQDVFSLLTKTSDFSPAQFGLLILFVAVIGPLIEEIFFRGFLYRALKRKTGVYFALLISAVLFSLIHFNVMVFFPILWLGIILGLLLEKTGSLIPCVAMHIMVNSISLTMLLFLK